MATPTEDAIVIITQDVFEYQLEDLPADADEAVAVLNKVGAQGWEVIFIGELWGDMRQALCKRKKR